MLHLERVRELGADEAHVDERQIDRSRQALSRAIASEQRSPRRSWRPALAGGIAAVVAIGAIVAGSVLSPAAAPTASAAEVLAEAAEATLTAEVLDPAPGQYIRIAETWTSQLSGWTDESDRPVDVEYRHTAAVVLYVPADRSDDWIDDRSTPAEVTVTRGDPELAVRIAESENAMALGAGNHAKIEAHPSGRIYGGEDWQGHVYLLNPLDRLYEVMPRDPSELLNWFQTYEPEAGYPWPTLGESRSFNLAPADLRVAMFRAIAMTDEAEVIGTDGDVTTIAFREDGAAQRTTIDVDTVRGLIVGGGQEGSPLGSAVQVSIVDEAPAGVRLPDAPQG